MQKMFKPSRLVLFFTILVAALAVYFTELYRIQIFETALADEPATPMRITVRAETLVAARGNIYDRNGVLLASGRAAYNVMLSRDILLREPGINNIILDLIYFSLENGIQHNDTLPITRGAPFTYISNITGEQRRRLNAFKEFHSIDPDISVQELLAWMRGHYRINYAIGITDARLIMGVRYEMEMRVILGHLSPYAFASDVDFDFIHLLEERGFPGLHIERGFIREYHTSYAAHLLGYIGAIRDHQMERFLELGYPMDALVGQAGVEMVFEEVLRGINGRRYVTTAQDGSILDVTVVEEPIPGNHIYLSICIDLQAATEHALRNHIESGNMLIEDEEERMTGGAVVAVDPWTGEVLASASFPTFNRFTLAADYPSLTIDPTLPLFDRAMNGRYVPGSTFKMVTGFVALRYDVVGRWTPISCTGIYYTLGYDRGEFRPRCWIHPMVGVGHGPLDIVQAIAQSCNYFFFHVADRTLATPYTLGGGEVGAWAIARAAQELGLGIRTGVEVPNIVGVLATPEWKEETQGELWWRGDTVLTAFGQGYNRFSPLQLAIHSATIANNGVLYEATILRRIRSADMAEILHFHEPTVMNRLSDEDVAHLRIIQEGMEGAARSHMHGTAASVFDRHPIRVAAKTGTIQIEGQAINDAAFIIYAPATNPQIAISAVIERGGSGAAIMDITRVVIDHFFRETPSVLAAPFGNLIP